MSGFGKEAGPSPASLSQPRFGPPSSSPSPHPSFPQFAPRSPEAAGRVRSPSLPYQTSPLSTAPNYQSAAIPSSSGDVETLRSPPVGFTGTGPATSPAFPFIGPSSESPSRWDIGQGPLFKDDAQTYNKDFAVTSFVASHRSGTSFTAKVARFQDLKRARSPPSLSTAQDISRNSSQNFFPSPSDHCSGNGNLSVPPRTRSLPLAFENYKSVGHVDPPFGDGKRLSPPARDELPTVQGNYPDMLIHQDLSVLPYAGSHDSIHATKRTRSPPVSPVTEVVLENTPSVQKEHKRTSMSPPRLGGKSNPPLNASNSSRSQKTLPSVDAIADTNLARTTGFLMAKRTRSPPFSSVDKFSQGNSYSTQDVAEREVQAKAKRLARFKEELSADFENSRDVADLKVSASGHEQAIIQRQKFAGGHSIESSDLTNNNISSDFEGSETSSIIIGLCPDMCPESERAERERKGDLDHFERLDGDRNQTNRFLAVKKYNRTAEREAILIRPLPILQNTIDYLLNLLDQPYNDKFLGMYNFLWDRMRAIRMDLRMQHIFSQESITMLEQMIRLHIIAMHELCEYRTGEGSMEGFDAHLNIEQMNKTSVELFQMYDDHRKKGIVVPTEKEFRGYYALLKLDKHPGYKVEPAELSLDLAKMTPEIRQTSEVLFARDVARACRTVNFIAFFRLARKASYLQACLMHAHFAKLRTQALASLHSGLQNSQGLPVALISKWLAMEEEVEELLKYHGFLIKEFEEPYMVKDGPFLNADKDYRTEFSKLVHVKKSKRIVDDVIAPSQGTSLSSEAADETKPPKVYKHDTKPVPSAFVGAQCLASETDEEVPDFEVVLSPKIRPQLQPMIEEPVVNQQSEDNNLVAAANISPWGVSWAYSSLEPQPAKLGVVEKLNHDTPFKKSFKRKMPASTEVMPLQIVSRTELLERSPSDKYDYNTENSIPQMMVLNNSGDEDPSDIKQGSENDEEMENYVDEEVAEAKLKLIIRLWRKRSLKLRELRVQRQMTADAALSSLSLGPPIRQTKDQSITVSRFDIYRAVKERYENHERSWSRLNVSDEIADVLSRRNPDAKCLCWKIILCSQLNNQAGDTLERRSQVMQVAAGSWLCSKLMPSTTYDDNDDSDLLISSPGLAIWRKWLPSQSGNDLNCCLSVVKDVKFDNLNETVAGASAVLFLVSESIPWNLQKTQLHNLLASIPSGSSLPLLVLSDLKCREGLDLSSIIVSELGLQHIDKSQISSFSIIFLLEDKHMEKWDGFFSDMRLREGLQWLASESPLQPDLHCIKTRDLVLTFLNPSLDVLEGLSDYEVSPNHCISAFNEALDCSVGKIAAAAKSNPTSWPCPEIALLGNFCDEQMVANWYLPNIGWSLAERIEPLFCTIRNCKLPSSPDAMAWLDKGANMDNEIEDLRLQLENFLIRYLTDSSGMMGHVLATKEAHVMVQSARLELRDSSYHIVPKWTKVFRRIFNWRLTSLSSGVFSSAFVLRCQYVELASRIPYVLQLEGGAPLPYLCQPSLDEVISAYCRPFLSGRDQSHAEAFQHQPRRIPNDYIWKDANMSGLRESQRTSAQNGHLLETENNDRATNQSISTGTGKVTKDADKLSKLLERCNIVQNSIGKKLSIYF